uniref:Uncharacterized protein n=1 Tax=Candidatus Kentrum sp. TC TaxID=2126339 RepID=A0A450YE05_9GAMM|nr:MAG: hypothetical protein BECKTC1821E_GA0114239_100540 [Candidatus Kentron sp. TC]
MAFDSIALGIALGVVGSLAFWLLEFFHRRHEHDVRKIATVFLSAFGIVAGIDSIIVAFQGNPGNLPSAWRQYLAFAGVIAVYLSLNFIVQSVKEILISFSPPQKNGKHHNR